MYDVSQTYINKLFAVGKKQRRIVGTIGDIPFTETDILADSLTITDKCLSSDDINLGGVFIGQLELTFLPQFGANIPRGTWKDREINISIGLQLSSELDTWEDVPVKPFYVAEATHSKNGISITAYDVMERLDKKINFDTSAGTIYDFLTLACSSANVPLGMTAAQVRALPNGSENLGLYPENDCETLRDLVSWLAVTAGGYATINRAGELVIRNWHRTPDLTIDMYHRDVSGKWSDFNTYYTGLSVMNVLEETTEYYNIEPDTGLTMKIGNNPFMQYGVKEVRAGIANNILRALQSFVYTPFSSNSYIDIALDLGDVIEYTDGLAGDSSICCIHKFSFSYSKGVKLTGYGKNPAIFGAQSKTDKNISGLLSRQDSNEIIAHTYVNTSQIDVSSTLAPLVNIRFATVNSKFVKFLGELEIETTADEPDGIVTAEITYYINDEIQEYQPLTSWDNDGSHLMHLLYWIQNMEAGQTHRFEAYIKVSGGTATIKQNGVHALIEGQGLVASESWDGFVEIEESGYSLVQSTHGLFDYTDTLDALELREIDRVNLTDSYSLVQSSHGLFNYTSSVDIITHKTEYDIINSDGEYYIGSTDDEYYIGSAE